MSYKKSPTKHNITFRFCQGVNVNFFRISPVGPTVSRGSKPPYYPFGGLPPHSPTQVESLTLKGRNEYSLDSIEVPGTVPFISLLGRLSPNNATHNPHRCNPSAVDCCN